MASRKPKGLGRGLDTLLGTDTPPLGSLGMDKDEATDRPSSLALSALKPGKYQPRTRMDEQALNELAESIRTQGIMQPILVRPLATGKTKKYEIIAGERRYRAAKLAGLKKVPVLVREVENENAAIMALIENLQREDLNPLEEAHGIKRLLDDFGLTHEKAAQAIGRSRSATTNILRLLNLSEPVQTMLLAGDIEMGHARALLAADAASQIVLANEIVAKRLSVRQAEKLIGKFLREADSPSTAAQSTTTGLRNGDVDRLEKALSDHLGTQVQLKLGAKNRGTLQISFHDWDHLNSLLDKQGMAAVLEKDA